MEIHTGDENEILLLFCDFSPPVRIHFVIGVIYKNVSSDYELLENAVQ